MDYGQHPEIISMQAFGSEKNAHSGSYVIECGTNDAGEIQNGTDAVYWDIWVKSIEGI